MEFRVIRVGGSLLTWDRFLPCFRRWLSSQPPARNVLIAGGGPWVELLRQAAKRFDIRESEAHVICLEALNTTASLLASMCGCEMRSSLQDVEATFENIPCSSEMNESDRLSSSVVFRVYDHLEVVDFAQDDALPRTWQVTSDSIAARIARDLGAAQLVLLKSSDYPKGVDSHRRLGELGYVDPYFEFAAKDLVVSFENLRRF